MNIPFPGFARRDIEMKVNFRAHRSVNRPQIEMGDWHCARLLDTCMAVLVFQAYIVVGRCASVASKVRGQGASLLQFLQVDNIVAFYRCAWFERRLRNGSKGQVQYKSRSGRLAVQHEEVMIVHIRHQRSAA